jgi:hypothetical protein
MFKTLSNCMMTEVEIWGFEGGLQETRRVHEIFCKRLMGGGGYH